MYQTTMTDIVAKHLFVDDTFNFKLELRQCVFNRVAASWMVGRMVGFFLLQNVLVAQSQLEYLIGENYASGRLFDI